MMGRQTSKRELFVTVSLEDVGASAVSKHAEVEATKTMIDRVEDKFSMTPDRLVGDTNYGVAAMLGWLVDEIGIAPYVPVWNKSAHPDGTFSRSDFIFDEENNRYICRLGKRCDPRRGASERIHIAIAPANTTARFVR